MRSLFQWCGTLTIGWMMLGCEDNLRAQFDVRFKPPQRRISLKQNQTVVPLNTGSTFSYTPKRDPFRPHYLTSKGFNKNAVKTQPDPPELTLQRKKTPLERYELDSLKVVATITGVANPIAMIEVPNGSRGYIARRGTLIGRSNGRITRIYPDGIVVSQISRDPATGRRIISRVDLRIIRKQTMIEGSLEVGGRRIKIGSEGQIKRQNTANEARRRTRRLFRQRGAGALP